MTCLFCLNRSKESENLRNVPTYNDLLQRWSENEFIREAGTTGICHDELFKWLIDSSEPLRIDFLPADELTDHFDTSDHVQQFVEFGPAAYKRACLWHLERFVRYIWIYFTGRNRRPPCMFARCTSDISIFYQEALTSTWTPVFVPRLECPCGRTGNK